MESDKALRKHQGLFQMLLKKQFSELEKIFYSFLSLDKNVHCRPQIHSAYIEHKACIGLNDAASCSAT